MPPSECSDRLDDVRGKNGFACPRDAFDPPEARVPFNPGLPLIGTGNPFRCNRFMQFPSSAMVFRWINGDEPIENMVAFNNFSYGQLNPLYRNDAYQPDSLSLISQTSMAMPLTISLLIVSSWFQYNLAHNIPCISSQDRVDRLLAPAKVFQTLSKLALVRVQHSGTSHLRQRVLLLGQQVFWLGK
jgi:hypothetical protein